jgi:hypothetical protein
MGGFVTVDASGGTSAFGVWVADRPDAGLPLHKIDATVGGALEKK